MTHPLAITMTSCDRWDLFQQTLDSFFKLNSYPYVAFHVHNDSVKPIPIEIKAKYADKNITWHEGTKRGLSAAWDYLVALVETEYFLNLEDDFEFNGNADFIEHSIFLIKDASFDQVWIREKTDHSHPIKPQVHSWYLSEKKGGEEHFRAISYSIILESGDWCGFTFNPALRNLANWNRMFPNGITGKDEIELSRELKGKYLAVSLSESACRHIGNGQHTKDFKI